MDATHKPRKYKKILLSSQPIPLEVKVKPGKGCRWAAQALRSVAKGVPFVEKDKCLVCTLPGGNVLKEGAVLYPSWGIDSPSETLRDPRRKEHKKEEVMELGVLRFDASGGRMTDSPYRTSPFILSPTLDQNERDPIILSKVKRRLFEEDEEIEEEERRKKKKEQEMEEIDMSAYDLFPELQDLYLPEHSNYEGLSWIVPTKDKSKVWHGTSIPSASSC